MSNMQKYLTVAVLLAVIVLTIAAVSAGAQTGDMDNSDYYCDNADSDENVESDDSSFGNTLITIGILFIFMSFVASRLVKFQIRAKR